MKDKRRHGDPDRIMEHAEAGYCLSHSEELHLCKYTRSLRSDLAEKTAAWEEAWDKIEWLRVALKRQFWRAQVERAKIERLREALTNIHDYGIDRDGETTAEKLGELVDELVQLAREALAATADGNEEAR